jgi:hypothetical protein
MEHLYHKIQIQIGGEPEIDRRKIALRRGRPLNPSLDNIGNLFS